MNREIKFRAWHEKSKSYVQHITSIYLEVENSVKCVNNLGDEKVFTNVILEQYTGLKDKNGVEVYFNSDICSFTYLNDDGSTEFFEGTFNYNDEELRVEIDLLPKYEGQGYVCLWYDFLKMKDFEIIGNIHQNKELLK